MRREATPHSGARQEPGAFSIHILYFTEEPSDE
jgi:hypothetical protein